MKPSAQPEKLIKPDHHWIRLHTWLPLISLLLGLSVWWAVTRIPRLPAFILPSPGLVNARFWQVLLDGSLLWHTMVTLFEVLAGMSIGVTAASALGYWLAKSPAVERVLSPYIVASQAVPIVAIAPLLVIWFGPGLFSKVLITAMIVFFPVLVNTVVGLRSVSEDLRDLFRSLLASPWQTFTHLEVPAALPIYLGGLRVGATLSVIGAVVGEFIGSDRGLGFLINVARGQYDTALVFVTILTLVILALGLYGIVVLAENRLLSWQKQPDRLLMNHKR
jgi:NitT/TauT family transport system permease protein